MINAYVTNLGKYNEGKHLGEFLKLPATTEEVQALFSRIKVDGVMYEEVFITDYKTEISGLNKCLGEYENLDELNYLASLLKDMDEWDIQKFEAAIAHGEESGSIQELINLTQSLDCFEYYPDVKDYDDLGRYLIEELDYEQIPEHLTDYFDYEGYAEAYVINEGGIFMKDGGFVFRNNMDIEEIYNGRNIPEEYKVFAYPPPETSIKKALAGYSQMIADIPKAINERTISPQQLSTAHADR